MLKESKQPLVSVVMAAYNAENYIGAAVDSVLKQSYSNLELIVINDGSTDNTAQELEKYLSDARVSLTTQENSGQTKSKNRGIEKAAGTYVGFCDADDMWHPEKLEKQVEKIQSDSSVGVVYSDTFLIDEEGKPIDSTDSVPCYNGNVLQHLLYDNFIPFGTVLVRNSCLQEVGGFNERYRMGIDWDLWLRISTKWSVSCVPEKLYYYRRWGGQMSRNYDGRYEGALEIFKKFRNDNTALVSKSVYERAESDIYANYAYHVSLYEGYNFKLVYLSAKAIYKGALRKSTYSRIARAWLRRF